MVKIYIDVNSITTGNGDTEKIQDLYRFSWFIEALKKLSGTKNIEVFLITEKEINKTWLNENSIDFDVITNDNIKTISKEHVLLSFDIVKIVKWENSFGKGILLQERDRKENETLWLNVTSTQDAIVNKLKNYLHIY